MVMDENDEVIYRKHAGDLRRLAGMLVGEANGDDVFTDAMLNATRSARWATLDDDGKRRYLHRTVVNQAHQWTRSRSRRERREDFVALRNEGTEAAWPDLDVWNAVATLGTRARAVIFLTYWEDLDGETVARELGISERSVRRDLARARRELRGLIDA